MLNTTPKTKKTVKIAENDLVDLIDNILTESLAVKKQEWLAEQKAKDSSKNALLETRLAELEKKFKTLSEGKK